MGKRRKRRRQRYAGPQSGGSLQWREVAIEAIGKQWTTGDGRAWVDRRGWFRVMVYDRFGGISLGEKHIDASRRQSHRHFDGELRWSWVPIATPRFRETGKAFLACEQLAIELAEELAEQRPPKPPPPRKRAAKQEAPLEARAQNQNSAPPFEKPALFANFRPCRRARR